MRIEQGNGITYVHSEDGQGTTINVYHPKRREGLFIMQPARLVWAGNDDSDGEAADAQSATDFALALLEAVKIAKQLNKEAGIHVPPQKAFITIFSNSGGPST